MKSLWLYCRYPKLELSSLRSRPPRLSESDGGQAQLECWNNGILGSKRQRAESKEFLRHAPCSMLSAYFYSMCEAIPNSLKKLF